MIIQKELLRNIGLGEGEIKVYLALLELGETTTGPILKKTKVSQSIIYTILEKLIDKGLTSYIIKNKTKHFQATHPDKLEDYLQEKEKDLKKTQAELKDAIPIFLKLGDVNDKSKVQIYEGFNGVQVAHNNIYRKLKKGEEYYGYGIFAHQEEKYNIHWHKDHLKRIKLGLKSKLLFNKDTNPRVLINRNSYKGCEARYMPMDIKTPAWFAGCKDLTLIGLQENDLAIEIKSQKIADTFKAYFDELWRKSKSFS